MMLYIDVIFAFLIFFLALSSFFPFLYTPLYKSIGLSEESRACLRASSILASPGLPEDWNLTTVKLCGVAQGMEVNASKLQELGAMSDDQLKQCLALKDLELSLKVGNLTFGSSPAPGSRPSCFTFTLDVNGGPEKVQVCVWR